MKKVSPVYLSALLLIVLPFLTGCPIGLDYPLAPKGSEPANSQLIGTWSAASDSSEVQRVKFSKGESPNTFTVEVLEKGEMYVLEDTEFTAWMSNIEGRDFLIFKPENEDKFYHYCIEIQSKQIKTWDLVLLDGGVDAVGSTGDLRKQTESSLKSPDFFKEVLYWEKEGN